MKTMFKNNQRVNLYTLSDLAAALHLNTTTLWFQVYKQRAYPKPTRHAGHRRLYYSEDVFTAIVKACGPDATPVKVEVAQ